MSTLRGLTNIVLRVTGARGQQGFKGDPGGNVMAIGLFTSGIGLNIPVGTDLVQTSGHHIKGIGPALYRAYDANPGLPASAQFQTANGRWFGYCVNGPIYAEQLGAVNDCPNVDFNYQGNSYSNSWTVPVGVTDNLQPINDCFAVANQALNPNLGAGGSGTLIPICFYSTGDASKAYFFSGTIVPTCTIHIKGATGPIGQFGIGTTFRFPPNTAGIVFNQGVYTAPYKASAAGFILEGIYFAGGGGTDRTKHGFQQRMPGIVRDCVFDSFSGNNTHNVGNSNGNPADLTFGLTSGSYWENVTCMWAGNWNTYTGGSDVSASTFVNLHHRGSRLGGLYDQSYYVNTYIGYQNNAHGGGQLGACYNNGYYYFLISTTSGIGGSTTPGTNEAVWETWQAASGPNTAFPQWVSGNDYEVSTPVFTASACLIGPYIEDYYLPMYQEIRVSGGGGETVIFGGVPQGTKHTNQLTSDSDGFLVTRAPFQVKTKLLPANAQGDTLLTSRIGDDGGNNVIQAWSRSSESAEWTLSYNGPDMRFGYYYVGTGNPDIYRISGQNTTKAFGRSAPVPGVFEGVYFAIGSPFDSTAGRLVQMGSQLPGGGNVAKGEIVFNNNVSAGGSPGWVCTTGGVAGSTAVFKALAAVAS